MQDFNDFYLDKMFYIVLAGLVSKLQNYPKRFTELVETLSEAQNRAKKGSYYEEEQNIDVHYVNGINQSLDGIGAAGELHACLDFLGMCRSRNKIERAKFEEFLDENQIEIDEQDHTLLGSL